jgi:hypothetical protein
MVEILGIKFWIPLLETPQNNGQFIAHDLL